MMDTPEHFDQPPPHADDPQNRLRNGESESGGDATPLQPKEAQRPAAEPPDPPNRPERIGESVGAAPLPPDDAHRPATARKRRPGYRKRRNDARRNRATRLMDLAAVACSSHETGCPFLGSVVDTMNMLSAGFDNCARCGFHFPIDII